MLMNRTDTAVGNSPLQARLVGREPNASRAAARRDAVRSALLWGLPCGAGKPEPSEQQGVHRDQEAGT
jgi:hypothetical protein